MKEENNLVRRIETCENMGGVDNICTGKAGVLTKFIMTVTRIYTSGNTTNNILDENIMSN